MSRNEKIDRIIKTKTKYIESLEKEGWGYICECDTEPHSGKCIWSNYERVIYKFGGEQISYYVECDLKPFVIARFRECGFLTDGVDPVSDIYYTEQEILSLHNSRSDYQRIADVYLFRRQLSKFVKIGVSHNPEKRLSTINRGQPDKANLIDSFICIEPYQVEKYMHNLYPSKRLGKTEWFDLSENELEVVRGVLKSNSLESIWDEKQAEKFLSVEVDHV